MTAVSIARSGTVFNFVFTNNEISTISTHCSCDLECFCVAGNTQKKMPSLGIQWPLTVPGGREKPCTHYLDEDRRSRYDLRLIWKLLWCLQQQWLASPVASALGGQDGGSERGRNFPQKSRRFNLNPQTTIEAGCSNGIHCVATGRWRRWGWRLGNEHQNGIRTSRQLRDATPPTRRPAR